MSGGTGPSGLASSRFTASSLPSPAALSSQGVGSFPWTVLTCSAHPGQAELSEQDGTERASHVRLQAVIVVLRVDFSCHYYEGHKGQDASSERESRGHSHRFVGGKTRAPVTSSQNLICMVMLSC